LNEACGLDELLVPRQTHCRAHRVRKIHVHVLGP
jgi:hypothetical protein